MDVFNIARPHCYSNCHKLTRTHQKCQVGTLASSGYPGECADHALASQAPGSTASGHGQQTEPTKARSAKPGFASRANTGFGSAHFSFEICRMQDLPIQGGWISIS
jgi:hypothetical protein